MSRITRASLGQQSIYNNPLPIQGGSFVSSVNTGVHNLLRADKFARKHKLVTKGSAIASILGADRYLDDKTNGYYSKAVSQGKQMGYGKKKTTKKKRKSTKKKK
jgi:hypothetical protein